MQTLAQQMRIMSACQQRWEDPDDYYDDDDEPEENPECPVVQLVSVLATTKKNKKIFPKKFLTAPKNSSIVCLA